MSVRMAHCQSTHSSNIAQVVLKDSRHHYCTEQISYIMLFHQEHHDATMHVNTQLGRIINHKHSDLLIRIVVSTHVAKIIRPVKTGTVVSIKVWYFCKTAEVYNVIWWGLTSWQHQMFGKALFKQGILLSVLSVWELDRKLVALLTLNTMPVTFYFLPFSITDLRAFPHNVLDKWSCSISDGALIQYLETNTCRIVRLQISQL